METLIYFLILGALFFFMMRFGCGSHVMGHGHAHGDTREADGSSASETLRWAPPAKDVDPVCGMTVETAKAKSAVQDGRAYYFCSVDCRDKFETDPARYLTAAASAPREREHSHVH